MLQSLLESVGDANTLYTSPKLLVSCGEQCESAAAGRCFHEYWFMKEITSLIFLTLKVEHEKKKKRQHRISLPEF